VREAETYYFHVPMSRNLGVLWSTTDRRHAKVVNIVNLNHTSVINFTNTHDKI